MQQTNEEKNIVVGAQKWIGCNVYNFFYYFGVVVVVFRLANILQSHTNTHKQIK